MMRAVPIVTCLISAGLIFTVCHSEAEGCAALPRRGDSIEIAEESAVIVWDSARNIQHFIRRAAFDTKSPDFGFLVPTPTPPKLTEVKDRLFQEVDQWILPKTMDRLDVSFAPVMCMIGGCAMPSKARMAAGNVNILSEQRVGGYDATILQADDANDLSNWIKDHGYSADPELYAWLTPYVASKWTITAFKIIQDPHTKRLATTKPVRMSFAADRPFFPYREPEVKDEKRPPGHRLLRVFFIADSRMAGKFGNDVAWHAATAFADKLSSEQREKLVEETGIAAGELPAEAWLTTFEDHASPRPGKEEVYFEPSAERTPVRPPPIIRKETIRLPIDIGLILGAITYGVFRAIRRAGLRAFLGIASSTNPTREMPPSQDRLQPPWSAS